MENWQCEIEVRANARLGCEAWERAEAQPVEVRLTLRSGRFAKGAETDFIKDTVDYCDVAGLVMKACRSKEFALVEYLVAHIRNEVEAHLRDVQLMKLSVVSPLFQP